MPFYPAKWVLPLVIINLNQYIDSNVDRCILSIPICLMWCCSKAYCWREGCTTILFISMLYHLLLITDQVRSSKVVFFVLPLLWPLANHLFCMLSRLVTAYHLVSSIDMHSWMSFQPSIALMLKFMPKYLHLCFYINSVMRANLLCRVLSKVCIINVFLLVYE